MFGAYTQCSWPKGAAGRRVVDRSGQSFLFSLVNATGRAVRFSLRDKSDAIGMTCGGGVRFGGHGCIFTLYRGKTEAGEAAGNLAYSLSEESAYQPDDGKMNRGVDFFAGSEFFAAADIEVYEL